MENKENRSIGKWISIIHRQSQIYINNELKQYDINSSEYVYLLNLDFDEGLNQKYLSDILCIDEAFTTRAIRSLEQKGYVIREKSLEDKRAYSVKLSEKGREIKPLIIKKLTGWTQALSDGMDKEQVELIIHALERMSNNAMIINRGEMK